ncbi:hypothetical protein IFR05_011893 [Cadophora sp. M221]|nr:hypothetical protein IFR05_011893 [Cadophora sp. M221]
MASTTPASSNLLDLLQYYDIFKSVCFNLDIGDLFSVRHVSRTLSRNYSAHWKTRWDINRSLKRFVRDPRGLRSLMAHRDAIITGSFVIQFFDGFEWPTTGLDILVPMESEIRNGNSPSIDQNFFEFTTKFGKYLCEMEGYKRIANNETSDDKVLRYSGLPPLSVEKLIRPQTETTPERRINILLTRYQPNKAYSLFPDATFLHPRKQHKIQPEILVPEEFLQKYEQRGLTAVEPADPFYGPEKLPRSIYPTRRIAGVKAAKVPDFVLELSYFDLYLSQYWYSLFAVGYRHPALKYGYMRPYGRDDMNFWHDYVVDKLENAIKAEIEGNGWPDGRTFYDHLLPGWHDEW